MRRALWPLLVALTLGGGCRGPGWYADKSPLEIAEMVEVELTSLGPGEAGYSAPEIAGDRRYRLSEFNFASDFRNNPQPTLVPARHFSAGAPRGLFITFTATLGGGP